METLLIHKELIKSSFFDNMLEMLRSENVSSGHLCSFTVNVYIAQKYILLFISRVDEVIIVAVEVLLS